MKRKDFSSNIVKQYTIRTIRAGEMAQWLRALTALPKDPGFPKPTWQLTTVCNSRI